MTRARASLLVLTAILPLTVAACATQKKPLTGYDKQPPGSITLDDDMGATVAMWLMFDVPESPQQLFRIRLNGKDIVYTTGPDGFYDYYTVSLQGWTGGWSNWIRWITPDTYVFEVVDSGGQSWGKSAPLAVSANGDPFNASGQFPAVVLAHYGDTMASWTIDPMTQDADTTTDEITVTNLMAAETVVVDRCSIVSSSPTSCTPVGTVAPGGELLTVEKTTNVTMKDDHQALIVRLANDASQSYQRDLLVGSGNPDFGSTCQVERIFVHGERQTGYSSRGTAIAMSSCYGYQSGPM